MMKYKITKTKETKTKKATIDYRPIIGRQASKTACDAPPDYDMV